jgi:cyclophilin family peptidyl-prolyl cis-trans isomerase
MSQRSRRGKKKSTQRRNSWIVLAVIGLLVVSGAGVYVYTATLPKSTATSTSSGSTTSTSSVGSSVTGAGPYAVLNTSLGTMVVQLFPQVAPKTVANFESLSESGFYNNLVWHRILPASSGFGIIQTGDPNTRNGGGNRSQWGEGTSSTSVPLEVNSAYHNDVGYVALAHTASSTSGSSQFYINLTNNSAALDGQYTVFGKIISGISVMNAIGNVPTYTSSTSPYYEQPVTLVYLTSVTIQDTP